MLRSTCTVDRKEFDFVCFNVTSKIWSSWHQCTNHKTSETWHRRSHCLPRYAFSTLILSKFFKFICVTFDIQVKLLIFQVHPLSSPSSVFLKLVVELWMSLLTGHWVVETVLETALISTSSTLPPMLQIHHMEDFWTSPMPVSHSMNWLV